MPGSTKVTKSTTGPIAPIAGFGPAGSAGPVKVPSLSALAARSGGIERRPPPEQERPNLSDPSLFNSPVQTRSADASFSVGDSARARLEGAGAGKLLIGSGFDSYSAIDVGGATNGTYILTTNEYGDIHIFTLGGTLVSYVPNRSFYCGVTPLPVCSAPNGYNGDGRVEYDTVSGRWIMTGLWIRSVPVQTVLAVSESSDPTGSWYLYQFPSCGSYDTWDGSDQPHTGFSSQWIASIAACEANPSNPSQVGAGLAVFDKAAVYSGQVLSLNKNWFEFQDPVELAGNRDNPTVSYSEPTNNSEYLIASAITTSGFAAAIFSYLQGSTDSPIFYSKASQVTTSFLAGGTFVISTPGCNACISSYANGWIHSSSIFTFKNGQAYVLANFVLGDPRYTPSTQVVSIALNSATGGSTAMQLAGGEPGSGALAAEIGMPLYQNYAFDAVSIAYDYTASNYFPGLQLALWDVDSNSLQYVRTLQEGSLTPSGSDASRWGDFLDAMAPVPGSSRVLVGGTVARASIGAFGSADPQRAIFYSAVTP